MRWFTAFLTLALTALGVTALFPQTSIQPARMLSEEKESGLELWQTALGPLWIPSPGYYVMIHLQWEQVVQQVYNHPSVHVEPGDIVVDCGAHIGGFTRMALRMGARMVVAIEPEAANLRAFARNLEQELKSGTVKLVRKGVWDKSGKLPLRLSGSSGDSHSLVFEGNKAGEQSIELTTLDAVAESLQLPRIHFIKMDIEGAERNALRGAQEVIRRWHPRLAISSYHLPGDPEAICRIVWETRTDYRVAGKDLINSEQGTLKPKVLFFY